MTRHFSDIEIIESIRLNDKNLDSILHFLYDSNYGAVKKMVLSYGGSTDQVPDIFQDAVISTYNSILDGRFKGDSAISTYIYAVARNMWLKSLRRSAKTSSLEISTYENVSDESEVETHDDQTTLLLELVNRMGKDCRTILLDFYFNKLSMSKIMEKFGLGSAQAAKNKKYRCMKELMTLCEENGLTKENSLSDE